MDVSRTHNESHGQKSTHAVRIHFSVSPHGPKLAQASGGSPEALGGGVKNGPILAGESRRGCGHPMGA